MGFGLYLSESVLYKLLLQCTPFPLFQYKMDAKQESPLCMIISFLKDFLEQGSRMLISIGFIGTRYVRE